MVELSNTKTGRMNQLRQVSKKTVKRITRNLRRKGGIIISGKKILKEENIKPNDNQLFRFEK